MRMLINSSVAGWLAAVFVMLSLIAASAMADKSPDTKFWGSLVVTALDIQNNQSNPLRGAKVTVALADPAKAARYVQRYGDIGNFPRTKYHRHQPVWFSHLPPSNLVGKYTVTVDPKPGRGQDYACQTQSKTLKKGSGEDRLNFRFSCVKGPQIKPQKNSGTINSSDADQNVITIRR